MGVKKTVYAELSFEYCPLLHYLTFLFVSCEIILHARSNALRPTLTPIVKQVLYDVYSRGMYLNLVITLGGH